MINRDVARFGGAVCLCLSVAGNAATAADCGPKVEAAFHVDVKDAAVRAVLFNQRARP